MTTPGVGPVVSLTYRATVDISARFRKSKSVGAVFGLTCAKYQSGEVDWDALIVFDGLSDLLSMTPWLAQRRRQPTSSIARAPSSPRTRLPTTIR
jgi:transposase